MPVHTIEECYNFSLLLRLLWFRLSLGRIDSHTFWCLIHATRESHLLEEKPIKHRLCCKPSPLKAEGWRSSRDQRWKTFLNKKILYGTWKSGLTNQRKNTAGQSFYKRCLIGMQNSQWNRKKKLLMFIAKVAGWCQTSLLYGPLSSLMSVSVCSLPAAAFSQGKVLLPYTRFKRSNLITTACHNLKSFNQWICVHIKTR